MTATLTFTLPDEQYDFNMAVNGAKFCHILFELDQVLRGEIKHGSDNKKAEHYQEIRDRLYELANENNVNFNE